MSRCPEDITEQFIDDCATLTSPVLALKYCRAQSTIREWRLELYQEGRLLWWPGIRVHADSLNVDPYVEIEGDVMAISDLEVPHHDVELLGYLVSTAMKFGIKKLVIAGDFLALDSESTWPQEEGDNRKTLADDKWSGEDVLSSLFEWFEYITILKGNHEQRGSRHSELGFIKDVQYQWGQLGNLSVSMYKWCLVHSAGQVYRIEHFGNYSKIPGSVARERSEIEGCHVLGGHTHHFSRCFDRSGRYQAVDLGHGTMEATRYYKTVNGTTRHPKWVSGFWMIRNGYLYPFPKQFTDWAFWLKNISVRKGE